MKQVPCHGRLFTRWWVIPGKAIFRYVLSCDEFLISLIMLLYRFYNILVLYWSKTTRRFLSYLLGGSMIWINWFRYVFGWRAVELHLTKLSYSFRNGAVEITGILTICVLRQSSIPWSSKGLNENRVRCSHHICVQLCICFREILRFL